MLSEERMKKLLYDLLMELDIPEYICSNEEAAEIEEYGNDPHRAYCVIQDEYDQILEWLNPESE